MPTSRRLGALALTVTAAVTAATVAGPAGGALAARPTAAPPAAAASTAPPGSDVGRVPEALTRGKDLPLDTASLAATRHAMAAQRKAAAAADPAVGEVKPWLALNDSTGGIYAKTYTMRGLGDHVQVWVADDRAFPTGDCRNDLGLTDVTDAQVANFVHEFDSNIYPKESRVFSVPPSLNGADAPQAGLLGLPDDYYEVSAAQADDIVVLVDNVRDANYYEPTTPDGQTYIAGFFYGTFNAYANRNIMTIDAFDWLHRTGADPVDDSADPAYLACTAELNAQPSRGLGIARPHLYEGVFAHEYQHLLESYEDPDEQTWVNEGLSDWAQTLVGYVDPTTYPNRPTADSHLSCFAGYLGESFGGPENSLTGWGDQGGPETLCDYGAVYSFMEYLHSHYGTGFMTALHREDRGGIDGLNKVLRQFGAGVNATTTINRWAAMMATDQVVDARGISGGDRSSFTARTLSMRVNWNTPQAYESAGAPPNGSDYVRLRGADGKYLASDKIGTIEFAGDTALAPTPVEWEVDATPPTSTTVDTTCEAPPAPGSGPAALYSGCGINLDRSIVRPVEVPTGSPELTFDALWNTEEGWDFGFAQVSTDGGATWTSLASEDTTSETDPGAIPAVSSNVPGFTGAGDGFRSQTADLSAYAGQSVLLAFRYVTDPGVNGAGFWVRDIAVDGTQIPATLDGWQSMSQLNPTAVSGWSVQLVGYSTTGKLMYTPLQLKRDFTGKLVGTAVQSKLGARSTTVGAIVTFEDPSETATAPAGYSLTVNGVTQPGG